MITIYFDATAGIAGDMAVAALLDLGLPFEYLQQELAKLGLPKGSYELAEQPVMRQGMAARQFMVQLPADEHHHHDHNGHHHHHRRYATIREMIATSGITARVKELSQRIFLRLAEAEALAHQVAVDEVTFHEVGAADSIVDIVGVAIGLDWLGVEQVYTSAVPLGGGFVETAHGRLPVPAPATAELLKGLAVHGQCGNGERVTPTGAAVLAALAQPLRVMPDMIVERIGHGAGTKDFEDCPNVLRVMLGVPLAGAEETIVEAVCNLDDVTGEVLGYTLQRLLEQGALDAWHTPIQMKKQRPGVQLSFLCRQEHYGSLARLVMAETGTLGVRHHLLQRTVQPRQVEQRMSCYGPVRFKIGMAGCKPEYDDCCRIAREQEVPLREVQRHLQEEQGHGH
jgi:pyridinium-3,5-bisthiocarboxylic acid mononucleotide nickel chelatase